MKTKKARFGVIAGLVMVAAFSACATSRWATPVASADDSVTASSRGIAVVELFTSQGCSSCPPADVALKQIEAAANKNGLPVHVLSFHVDYWNRLGWKDPFSDSGHTRRQQSYAALTGSSRVYTPQMIVNGATEFVGSDRAKANVAISKALQQSSHASIQLTHVAEENGWKIGYRVDGAQQGFVLNVALVDTPDGTSVIRGENAGRKLHHVNVVRNYASIPLDSGGGEMTISRPENFSGNDSQIIAYVQDPQTGEVVGANAIVL